MRGFTTDKDKFAIQDNSAEIKAIIKDLISDETDNELRDRYSIKDSRDWKLSSARKSLMADIKPNTLDSNQYITKVCYRPFDYKYTYLHKNIVTYPRPILQKDMIGRDNLALCVGKQGTAIGNSEWSLVYISSLPADKNVNPRGGAYLFPLYQYDDEVSKEFGNKLYNFNYDLISSIGEKVGLRLQDASDTERTDGGFMGVDVIDYIYAVLHSHKYRKRYHQFLQNDFPIIPYPESSEYFFPMADYGKRLRELHQLIGISQNDFITQYPVSDGEDVVTKRVSEETEAGLGKVWINNTKYFDKVPKRAWELFISGYQPLDKWLKDRNCKKINGDDIRHFQRIVVALDKTSAIMEEIDSHLLFANNNSTD